MVSSFRSRTIPVLFGPGAALQTGASLKEKGITKVIVVYDQGIKGAGISAKVIDSIKAAGIGVVEYDNVITDVPDKMVDEIAALARKEKIEAIVGLGGGSSLDTAKAVNILIHNDPPINDYMMGGKATGPRKPGIPLILIPTTSGTGSEATSVAVVTDSSTNAKKGVGGPTSEATLSIVDPELAAGMPPAITAFTGIDALAHALEAYTGEKRNPMSDTLAEKAANLIKENLPLAIKDGKNIELRTNMSFAALIAGTAFSDSIVHLGHSIAHTLGAIYHIPHGIGCSISLPVVLEYVADVVPDRILKIGQIMGFPVTADMKPDVLGKTVANGIRAFTKSVGVPGFLEAAKLDKVDDAAIAKVAEVAMGDSCTRMTPKKPSMEDVIKVVRKAIYPDS